LLTLLGIGLHPTNQGSISFNLGGQYDLFTGVFGPQNEFCNNCGQNIYSTQFYFTVTADGVVKYTSPTFSYNNFILTASVSFSIAGVNILTITSNSTNSNCAHAVIGDAKVRKNFNATLPPPSIIAPYSSLVNFKCEISAITAPATFDGYAGFTCTMTIPTVNNYVLTITATSKATNTKLTIANGNYQVFAPKSLSLNSTKGNIALRVGISDNLYFNLDTSTPTNILNRLQCATVSGGIRTFIATSFASFVYNCSLPAVGTAGIYSNVTLVYSYSGYVFDITSGAVQVPVLGPASISWGSGSVDASELTSSVTTTITSNAWVAGLTSRILCTFSVPSVSTSVSADGNLAAQYSAPYYSCAFTATGLGVTNLYISIDIGPTGTRVPYSLSSNFLSFFVTRMFL
jgi:hypothetical protein